MKAIRDLQRELIATVGRTHPKRAQDHRFRGWAKAVDSVDRSKANGYAFEGEFVRPGTVEIEVKPRLFLVQTVNGSRQYQEEHYTVVAMDDTGELACTEIYTTGGQPGWALRIRDQVADLLTQMAGEAVDPLADVSDDQLIAALERRGYTVTR